jgi:hypothetical protein
MSWLCLVSWGRTKNAESVMKILAMYTHPDPKLFCSAVLSPILLQ